MARISIAAGGLSFFCQGHTIKLAMVRVTFPGRVTDISILLYPERPDKFRGFTLSTPTTRNPFEKIPNEKNAEIQ